MADASLPDTVEAAARWLLGGVLIFAFGFESVVMLWDGKFLLSFCSFVIAIALTLLLVYWSYLPTIILVIAAIMAAASVPLVFYGAARFIRERQIAKPMLMIIGTFLIVVALIAMISGGAMIYVAQTTFKGVTGGVPQAELDEVRDKLSAEQEARAVLDRQLMETKRELQQTRQQLEAARQAPVPRTDALPPGIPYPATATPTPTIKLAIETIGVERTRALVAELYSLKAILPEVWISLGPAPPSHDQSTFTNIFSRAGIKVATLMQQTEGPDQTGLMICVPDVNQIPEKVRKLAEALSNVGIETKFVALSLNTLNSNLPPDVGFTLFIGPKSL
jgi:hypothetical protein